MNFSFFQFQYYEMSYGLNVEMHKQVRDLILFHFFFLYKWLDTAGVVIGKDFCKITKDKMKKFCERNTPLHFTESSLWIMNFFTLTSSICFNNNFFLEYLLSSL